MKIKPSKLPGSVVMEVTDSDCLSIPSMSPFKLKKIVVPTDFSDCSKKELRYAIPFAKQFNATLILLHVVPRHSAIDGETFPVDCELTVEKDLRENARRKLIDLAKEFPLHEIPVQIETCLGATGFEIAEEARKLEADLIVISTHGRTGRAHALAGSVAENLVQLAPCPLLVVREHEHEFIQVGTANPVSRVAT
ncbi:MAG TPA: universal stress protein [Candidatus Acidoferrales bacterium]|jgi:universal stress protein A|nr:universal stress protein [Candidatus Acidoferrales bacterium]